MSIATAIGAIYCSEAQERERLEKEAAHIRNITDKVFGPISGSDSVEDTLSAYDEFTRSRLTPLP